MRRGTTPKNYFRTELDITGMDVLYITYKQGGQKVIEKSKEDIIITQETVEERTIYVAEVELSQEDTLALSTIGDVEIQIRGRYPDGSTIASNIIKSKVCGILKEGII